MICQLIILKLFVRNIKKNMIILSFLRNSKNLGVGASRNEGIKKSEGKYIIFVDSDDGSISKCITGFKKRK